jgi:DMSO/TMAO reductase YedYZ molybdopterin-dependent catalytic subunit
LQRWEDLDWLAPNTQFFNIAHYNRPHIDEQDWSLEIAGFVRKPGRFRLSDIRARPRRELIFTLECSGNNGRRSFQTGIGTARWAGTSLAAMLREAELLESGIEVVFVGADTGEEQVRDIKMPTSFARQHEGRRCHGPRQSAVLRDERRAAAAGARLSTAADRARLVRDRQRQMAEADRGAGHAS